MTLPFQPGDYVTRKSYAHDIVFVIREIFPGRRMAVLKGVDVRLIADAPLDDLEKVSAEALAERRQQVQILEEESLRLIRQDREWLKEQNDSLEPDEVDPEKKSYFEWPSKVLHLDGDPDYLRKCMDLYRKLSVPVVGLYVREAEMADAVGPLLAKTKPNILVLTGHDGFLKRRNAADSLANYRHSSHYMEAIKAARQVEHDLDTLVIVAGGCQSHFEALLAAGANFASSPRRVMIHTFDPVFVAQMIAFTPIHQTVNALDVAKRTITGIAGMGGIETRGGYRRGMPPAFKNWAREARESH